MCIGVLSKELTESSGQWEPSLMGYMDVTEKVSEKNASDQKNEMNIKKEKIKNIKIKKKLKMMKK